MLENVYLNGVSRGKMLKGSKDLELYKELVNSVSHHQEKGLTAQKFVQEFTCESKEQEDEEIPKPKIVKGMPPSMKKRLEEEY